MIQNLPIRLAASAAEPGFSLLVRNAAANAASTTKEFCAATGLNKALVCAGDTDQLSALAVLTGSDSKQLHLNSPQQLDRKTSIINGSRMLTRSSRKADLAVCPQCWLEQLEAGRSRSYHLSMNAAWLPRPVRTCLHHRVKLVELPYKDYTTCYGHPVRSKLQYGWLNNLTSMIEQQNPSAFEVALLKQVFQHDALCPMPYALCPMPYALCPMPYALCPMPYALGSTTPKSMCSSVGASVLVSSYREVQVASLILIIGRNVK